MPRHRRRLTSAQEYSTRAAIAALTPQANDSVILTEAGCYGRFSFTAGNLATMVTADSQKGVYIAPTSAPTGTSGAWVRTMTSTSYRISWFGPFGSVARAGAVSLLQALGGGTIYHPAGDYTFTEPIGYDLDGKSNIRIKGDGPNATSFIVGANNVKVVRLAGLAARCAIEDVWIGSVAARTGCYGIWAEGTSAAASVSQLSVARVVFQNITSAIRLKWVEQVEFDQIFFIQSIATACSGTQIDFDTVVNAFFSRWRAFTSEGTFGNDFFVADNDCDTLLFSMGTVQSVTGHGFRFKNSTGATGPRLIHMTDIFSEQCTLSGYFHEGICRDAQYVNCQASGNEYGWRIAGGTSIVIDGLALQNKRHGALVTGGTGITFTDGFRASNNSDLTDHNNNYDGIRIENNVTGVKIGSVRCEDYWLPAPASQRYGVSIGATGTDYITLTGGNLAGKTAPLGNFSTGLNNAIDNPNDKFTGALTGCTTAPNAVIEFAVKGRMVTLLLPALSAISNSTAATITGGPERMRPKLTARTCWARIVDNSTTVLGLVTVETTGVLTLSVGASAGAATFTAANAKGTSPCEISYSLD